MCGGKLNARAGSGRAYINPSTSSSSRSRPRSFFSQCLHDPCAGELRPAHRSARKGACRFVTRSLTCSACSVEASPAARSTCRSWTTTDEGSSTCFGRVCCWSSRTAPALTLTRRTARRGDISMHCRSANAAVHPGQRLPDRVPATPREAGPRKRGATSLCSTTSGSCRRSRPHAPPRSRGRRRASAGHSCPRRSPERTWPHGNS